MHDQPRVDSIQTIRYVHWRVDGSWLGYLEGFPDCWTQGDTLADFVDQARVVDVVKVGHRRRWVWALHQWLQRIQHRHCLPIGATDCRLELQSGNRREQNETFVAQIAPKLVAQRPAAVGS